MCLSSQGRKALLADPYLVSIFPGIKKLRLFLGGEKLTYFLKKSSFAKNKIIIKNSAPKYLMDNFVLPGIILQIW